MRAPMAKPREARGWFVYGVAVAVSFLVLAFRIAYADGASSPYFLIPFVDVPFVIAILAVALAALGLYQALWYSLVKPDGLPMYAGSLLMFLVALLLFYALPAHLIRQDVFLLQFLAALVLFAYVPTLSYRSLLFLGIGIAGTGVLLGSSLYGPLTGSAPLVHPLVLATIAAEGLLVLTLLRLTQLAMQRRRTAAA